MNTFRSLALVVASALPLTAVAQSFQEGFESYPALFSGANPWALQNRSDSVTGGQPWFPGDAAIFPAQSGAGYVAANYLSTGGLTGTETISNWLLSPLLNLTTGGTISFFTRSAGGAPDNMEIRLSLSGVSTNVGTTSTSVGDFTTLLLTINPTQTAGLYPTGWLQFTATLGVVPVGATGRIGFRYTVTNSGLNGANGDYIGVDNLTSTLITVSPVPEPSTYAFCLVGLAAGGWLVSRGAGRSWRGDRPGGATRHAAHADVGQGLAGSRAGGGPRPARRVPRPVALRADSGAVAGQRPGPAGG